MKVYEKLKRALRSRTKPRPAVLSCPPWTCADRDAWAHFLNSITGHKLIQRKQAIGAKCAIEGAKDVFHTAHSAGKSVGWNESTEWLLSLTQTVEVKQAEETFDERRQVGESLEEFVGRMTP